MFLRFYYVHVKACDVRGKVFCALSDVRGNVFLDVKGCVNRYFSLKERFVRHGLFPCFLDVGFRWLLGVGVMVLNLRGVDGEIFFD
jgi:hypothetical protein